jgi:hypothetical protein
MSIVVPTEKEATAIKCLVSGCENYSNQGIFIGELCSPYHEMLKTGEVHSKNITFIGYLKRDQNLLKAIASLASGEYPK